jgi:hypothetical protein
MNLVLKKILLLLGICSTLNVVAQKVVADDWYKIDIEGKKGYAHYLLKEDNDSLTLEIDFRVKLEFKIYKLNIKSSHEKDAFLTTRHFNLKGTSDDREGDDVFSFSGYVERDGAEQIWHSHVLKAPFVAPYPTISFHCIHYVFKELLYEDYEADGKLLTFNSVEVNELKLKSNHYIYYLGEDTTLKFNNKYVHTKKFQVNGNGIMESNYWLDIKSNKIIRVEMDGYKIYTLCRKEEIDLKEFE